MFHPPPDLASLPSACLAWKALVQPWGHRSVAGTNIRGEGVKVWVKQIETIIDWGIGDIGFTIMTSKI